MSEQDYEKILLRAKVDELSAQLSDSLDRASNLRVFIVQLQNQVASLQKEREDVQTPAED